MSKKHGSTGNQGFLQLILQLLQLLLQFFMQLLGGNTSTPVSQIPLPTQGVQPTVAQNPTQAPCPTQIVTSTPIPAAPTGSTAITPVPTGSTIIQPAVSYVRPGGGQWHLAFHDEFDGSGGTSADAMSGANFINKTVGGASLPGNPGLNPNKWNMGWQTGPDSLTGLGMVTTATTGMCPNGCTENDWYGTGSLVFPGDGQLHMRSQHVTGTALNPERNTTSTSSNEEGMITTAGLMALNPANSSHGNVSANRFVDGPLILEWKATNIFLVDWPAFWMANDGYFGHAGGQWPGGTSFQEEIDLLEPIFRMHIASEFQSGLSDIPSGWNQNGTLTFDWYFDS
ncbi:MAG TPA: hypothetical protein VNZ86_08060, partial [Bacteroidia bacterium]|nr:hypothetical protein [Bacteroidia bacterium]